MSASLRVLIVEDSDNDALLTISELRQGGLTPQWERVETAQAMRSALKKKAWDIIISDYQLPRFGGMEALAIRNEICPDVPFVIVSGAIGEDVAVAAMKKGANDYLLKGHLKRLPAAVERELRDAAERQARKKAEEAVSRLQKLEAIGRLAGSGARLQQHHVHHHRIQRACDRPYGVERSATGGPAGDPKGGSAGDGVDSAALGLRP